MFCCEARWTNCCIDSSTRVTLAFLGKLYISRFQSLAVLSLQDSLRAAPMKVLGDVTAKIPPKGREISSAPLSARIQRLMSGRVSENSFSRTRLQRFLSNPPRSSFKKLIILTPRLVQTLRTMSIAKAVPKGIKDRECKRFALREHPSVPYVPEKDPIQETISLLKSDQSLKTTIGVVAELRLPMALQNARGVSHAREFSP
jgi:hypothetical protein